MYEVIISKRLDVAFTRVNVGSTCARNAISVKENEEGGDC